MSTKQEGNLLENRKVGSKLCFHRDDSFSVPFHHTCLLTPAGSKKPIHAACKSSFKGFSFV